MEVGRALRRRREALGYSLEDVQAATKVRLRYLQAIEAERPGDLPGPVYARGFVRSYANFLELDGPALAAAWGRAASAASEDAAEAAQAAEGPPEPAGSPSVARQPEAGPRPLPEPPARVPGRRRGTLVALWLLALVAIAAAIYAWQAGSRVPQPTAAVGATAPAVASGTPAAQPAATGTASASPPTATATATAPPGAGSPRLAASTGTDASGNPVTTYTLTGSTSLSLVAQATADCWLRVWLDGSATYTDITLAPGQSMTWTARHQVAMRVGYPPGIAFTVGGQPIPASADLNPVNLAFVLGSAP